MNPTPEQFGRLEQLFSEALDLAPELRAEFKKRVRAEDGPAMADELEALLAAQSDETEPMFRPLVNPETLFPSAPSAFKDGDVILNRFRIVRTLPRGGMGEVYEAQDSEIGRVALKTIRADARDNSALLRFRQEVQLARLVTSPYVCRVHEFFTTPAEGNRPSIAFLTMEFLEGETLANRIEKQGPIPWRDAESIALQLCEALKAIHDAGVIHRDFKSSNVMLAKQGDAVKAVVLDLGLAHRPETNEAISKDRNPLTVIGTVMGTPDYMAPEQFESAKSTPATDIYAFGVVLYEMVTGKLPFEAATPIGAAVRRAKRPDSASSIQPGVPHRWDMVIEKCLQYEPTQRFQSATELAAALQRPSALHALVANRSRRRHLGLVMACVGLLATMTLGLTWYRNLTAHKVPAAAQRFYDQATDAFHNGSYLTATRQLEEAVRLDPDFALAHARLTDAFNELDSTGEAQREVNQIREELVGRLSSADQTYIHAVREAIRPDVNAALQDYEKLLAMADSPSDRASALVDVARTDERAGRISDAMQHFGEAMLLDPYLPTPHLRRGILESRQGKQKEADSDFATAEKLYATNINLEGTAEVDYQRSNVATKLGPTHEQEAREFFRKSLDAAEKMQSVALRVRALSRLSAIEYGVAHDEEAGKVAEEAVRLAEENGVAYWATDARVRLGNSWTFRDAKKAEEILRRARDEAERNRWPRLLSLGQLSLAVLISQQQKLQPQQEVVDLASPAYEYYRVFGFAQESFQCQLMLSRAKAFLGLFAESLQHARKALELANGLASPVDQLQGQEAVGTALLWKEDYPEALDHLTSAFQMAAGPLEGYLPAEALLRAGALIRLGRTDEAERTLATVPDKIWEAGRQRKLDHAARLAELLANQAKYKDSVAIAQRVLGKDSDWNGKSDLQLIVAEDLTRTGEPAKALALCDEMIKQAAEQGPAIIAEATLGKARASLDLGQWGTARALAEEANRFFEVSGQKESQLISLWLIGESYRRAGSADGARRALEKTQDILSDLRHNYETDDYQHFVERSGIAEMLSDGHQQQVRSGKDTPNGTERKAQ